MAVHVHVHDDRVTIDLDGTDAVWALARHLEVPFAHVTAARVAPVSEPSRDRSWKVVGGNWPGVVMTGWFLERDRRGARQFWSVYRDRDVLVIDTDLERPSRIVLQHPDRDRLAWLVAERIPDRRAS
jgi:hypothetical protein